MKRVPVYIAGPDKGAPAADARLLALVGLAIVQGFDPVVVGYDCDAAGAIGAGGGHFWAIERDDKSYDDDTSAAYRAWSSESGPDANRRRQSRPWAAWWALITSPGV